MSTLGLLLAGCTSSTANEAGFRRHHRSQSCPHRTLHGCQMHGSSPGLLPHGPTPTCGPTLAIASMLHSDALLYLSNHRAGWPIPQERGGRYRIASFAYRYSDEIKNSLKHEQQSANHTRNFRFRPHAGLLTVHDRFIGTQVVVYRGIGQWRKFTTTHDRPLVSREVHLYTTLKCQPRPKPQCPGDSDTLLSTRYSWTRHTHTHRARSRPSVKPVRFPGAARITLAGVYQWFTTNSWYCRNLTFPSSGRPRVRFTRRS